MTSKSAYTPNHIPKGERIRNLIFSIGLLLYGTIGVYIDDIYVPGKRSKGIHFHGVPCWVMYGALIMAATNLLLVIVDHYDKRNNETNYKMIAKVTRIVGWSLFFLALLLDLFFFHKGTKH